MERGSEINNEPKGKIKAYHDMKLSIRTIAEKTRISKSIVGHFIKKCDSNLENVVKKKPGRKPILQNRDKRRILRPVSNTELSASQVRDVLQFNCSAKTVYE